MSANVPRVLYKVLLVPLGLMMCIALGGWDRDELNFRYRAHSDKVTRDAGDAAASNIVIQTIDPWPPASRRTRIDQNGKRAYIAIKRYETNTSIPPKGIGGINGHNFNGNGYLAAPDLAAQK
jgi:hypothetical protein